MEKELILSQIIENCKNGDTVVPSGLEIRDYIPILEKDRIMRMFLVSKTIMENNDADAVSMAVELEVKYKFEILLNYTNIVVKDEDVTFENYDVLEKNLVFEHIYSVCHKDYDYFIGMIKDMIGFNNNSVAFNILKSIDVSQMNETIKGFTTALSDKENVKAISHILDFSDPLFKEAIETIRTPEIEVKE